jgi:hypothetical protein
MNVRWLARLGGVALTLGLIYGGFDLAGATGPPSTITGIVTVGNDTSNPVPVQQQGTATVNVNNTPLPVQQQGTATVNVNNASLPVTGTVKTMAGDNPAFQPITQQCSASANFEAACVLYTVPSGKELVVTSVSADGQFQAGATPSRVAVQHEVGGFQSAFDFPINLYGTANNVGWFSGGAATQFYADPGTNVVGVADMAQGNSILAEFNMDGYLVNLPS